MKTIIGISGSLGRVLVQLNAAKDQKKGAAGLVKACWFNR
jgi:hypothetical protein